VRAYLINALLLVIFVAVWLWAWSFALPGGPGLPDVWTLYLIWGGMLIPLGVYLVLVVLARRRLGLPTRVLAILLSPIVILWLALTTMGGDEVLRGIGMIVTLVIPFGLVARMPQESGRDEGTSRS
jgi:hypothetical protein